MAMSNVAALVLKTNFSDHILTEEVIKEANNMKIPIIYQFWH
ncbi:PucR family transcriptional regulator ligand-binding domain-containing protein [endosymbiont 'TC1' of Trimyema compressum]|nr:PucR family transcriptional regulator ligand-binding domain-containing protein [endosymbiont 'TC1' of Trimyema compressum]